MTWGVFFADEGETKGPNGTFRGELSSVATVKGPTPAASA